MLADDFYWLAHHDVTGKPRLHTRAVQLGCAAALLIELINDGHIGSHENVLTADSAMPPTDSLSARVLNQLIGEASHGRGHHIRVWLEFLAAKAPARIAQRLMDAKHLRRAQHRNLFRGGTTIIYLPTDSNVAATPWALLTSRIRRHDPLEGNWLHLAGLVVASGLETFILDGAPPAAFEHLRKQASTIPNPVRDVLLHTHTAIGEGVLAHRT